MASTQMFEKYPNFPKDVSTACLPKISLNSLALGKQEERSKLFSASRELVSKVSAYYSHYHTFLALLRTFSLLEHTASCSDSAEYETMTNNPSWALTGGISRVFTPLNSPLIRCI